MEWMCDNCGSEVAALLYINKKGRRRITWTCNKCGIRGFEDFVEQTDKKTANSEEK
jgi:predicted  nucleic acid-binding Zn-ribbon protein